MKKSRCQPEEDAETPAAGFLRLPESGEDDACGITGCVPEEISDMGGLLSFESYNSAYISKF